MHVLEKTLGWKSASMADIDMTSSRAGLQLRKKWRRWAHFISSWQIMLDVIVILQDSARGGGGGEHL